MPLLITPAAPVAMPCGTFVSQLYAIIDHVVFDRLTHTASFRLGYYLNEAASTREPGPHQVPVDLTRGFSFTITPSQAAALDNPKEVCEAYAQYQLSQVLPEGTTFEEVE